MTFVKIWTQLGTDTLTCQSLLVLRQAGVKTPLSNAFTSNLMKQLDADGNGTIEKDEFLRLFRQVRRKLRFVCRLGLSKERTQIYSKVAYSTHISR